MTSTRKSNSLLGLPDVVHKSKDLDSKAKGETNAHNKYEDFSGISSKTDNPYDALIEASNDDAREIQARYDTHREARNRSQKTRLLDHTFTQMEIDPILYKLVNKHQYPGYSDPRHCLVLWARPTLAVRQVVNLVQQRLLEVVPRLWLMPIDCLHMTTLEITHSVTEPEISAQVALLAQKLEEITNFTLTHRASLIRPMVSFDASALALSFAPAAGEGFGHDRGGYTYHHLRRDLHDACKSTRVQIASRYVVPSAHLTIGRFISQEDTCHVENGTYVIDAAKMHALLERIESINEWLKDTYWPKKDGKIAAGGEWVVGQEKGLDCCRGTLWYGNSIRVRIGEGF